MTDRHDYSLFGLRIQSELRLPELLEVRRGSTSEVSIRFGRVPVFENRRAGLYDVSDGLLLVIANVGQYFIRGGQEIIVEPGPAVPDENLRVYLLGSAMGALLHQRGLLPLHANAVAVNGSAFAFMGESGAGKSTLAAWFNDNGDSVLTDDVCVVGFDQNRRPQVCPGVGRLRLWREVIEITGRDVAAFQRSFIGSAGPDKFDVPLEQPAPDDCAIRLAAVYVLARADNFRLQQLHGVAAVKAIFANTYRGSMVAIAGSAEKHWSACMQLVAATPIFRAERIWGHDRMMEQSKALRHHAAAIGAQMA